MPRHLRIPFDLVETAHSESGAAGAGRSSRSPRPPSRRPWVGWSSVAVLVVLFVVVLVAGTNAVQRRAASAAEQAGSYAAPSALALRPLVAVVGDETAGGASAGDATTTQWTAIFGRSLGVTVLTLGQSGSGYTTRGPGTMGTTFAEGASRVPTSARAVVLFGGVHDAGASSLRIAQAAAQAIDSARRRAPEAEVIVVGPINALTTTDGSTSLAALRRALRSAAGLAGARWVDPIAQRWLTSEDVDVTGSLTQRGQSRLAGRMETVLRAVAPSSGPSANSVDGRAEGGSR